MAVLPGGYRQVKKNSMEEVGGFTDEEGGRRAY